MQNIKRDLIFTSFLYSAELDLDPQEVEIYANKCMDSTESVSISNRGGWQSQAIKPTNGDIMEKLSTKVISFANFVSVHERLQFQFDIDNFWININPVSAHNVTHSHAGVDLIAVYYSYVPQNSGDLVLLRNDSSICSPLFKRKPSETEFCITPEQGNVYVFPPWLLHYVEANNGDDKRVSVAFNLKIKQG
jgi:uncharacterized protein (TIGR02466 family)